MTVKKVAKDPIFPKKKLFLPTQLDSRIFCFFHQQDPKPKRIRQRASNRAKTRSTQSQTCVKYRGITLFI